MLFARGPDLDTVGAVDTWIAPLQRPQRLVAAAAGRTDEVSGLGRHILIIRERRCLGQWGSEESEKSAIPSCVLGDDSTCAVDDCASFCPGTKPWVRQRKAVAPTVA